MIEFIRSVSNQQEVDVERRKRMKEEEEEEKKKERDMRSRILEELDQAASKPLMLNQN